MALPPARHLAVFAAVHHGQAPARIRACPGKAVKVHGSVSLLLAAGVVGQLHAAGRGSFAMQGSINAPGAVHHGLALTPTIMTLIVGPLPCPPFVSGADCPLHSRRASSRRLRSAWLLGPAPQLRRMPLLCSRRQSRLCGLACLSAHSRWGPVAVCLPPHPCAGQANGARAHGKASQTTVRRGRAGRSRLAADFCSVTARCWQPAAWCAGVGG